MFSELSLATNITVLTPVSCYLMASFTNGGKNARNIGLLCRCHLNSIMPDSIFYDSMGWGMIQGFFVFLCLFVFSGVVTAVFCRNGFSLIAIIQVGVGKP